MSAPPFVVVVVVVALCCVGKNKKLRKTNLPTFLT
jgi:hypothetical protein